VVRRLRIDPAGLIVTSYRALLAVPGSASAAAAQDAFARAGFDAVAVTNFQDAVLSLRGSPPDFLATTIRLGDFNGLHLVLRARDLYPDLPVLILGTDTDNGADAAGFGASFLPFAGGHEAMVEAASGLLKNRAAQKSTLSTHSQGA
jgi:DNA-binding NtrC family response regulator